ncbi:MAG TPA: ARMT1-like domain-containing protein [Methanoregulaceae archaeon]|nr:ARMT1-like domain-containing protein [Methanoregulaceae archaeon]
MKLDDRCYDCLLSRVRLECSLCKADPECTRDIVQSCAELLSRLRDTKKTHPQIASAVHRHAYGILGCDDPFTELKIQSNREAMEVCRQVRPRLCSFRDLVLASIIGNTYDYGVKAHTVTKNFLGFFEKSFAGGLTIDDTDKIKPLTRRVVYFTDNCGEIVFDRLLLEFLHSKGAEITLVLREAPILNDATLSEAEELNLEHFVTRITTTGLGSELGVRLECAPAVLEKALAECTLIISKGMANYESLSLYDNLPPVAYFMSVKCEPVAEEVGVPRGSMVAMLRSSAENT